MDYNKSLFTEFRTLTVPDTDAAITDEAMVMAVTANENLRSLGYTLRPEGIVSLAKEYAAGSMRDISKEAEDYIGSVKADPMYPDFPRQVMNMSEAQFRFDQVMHYFSTYGLESEFGIKVSKGWLPDAHKTEKTKEQTALLPERVLDIIPESQKYDFAVNKILTKRERMTQKEKEMVLEAMGHVDTTNLPPIPFKENMLDIFDDVFRSDADNKLQILSGICQHTGDVLRSVNYSLNRCNYRLKTQQKKTAVRLIENYYSPADLTHNLVLTYKKAETSKKVMSAINFKQYSKSAAHAEAYERFCNGELRSWNGQLDLLLEKNNIREAVDFASQHPGELVRMTRRFLAAGASVEDIKNALVRNARSLSPQTLVDTITALNKPQLVERSIGRINAAPSEEMKEILKGQELTKQTSDVLKAALKARMAHAQTEIRGKKVYIDEGVYDFKRTELHANDKSEGYLKKGMAFKIPETANTIRFFTYWNDYNRVDVDLHAIIEMRDGQTAHVGWDGSYLLPENTAVHSGDITHSDAAEYIDVNLREAKEAGVTKVTTRIHLYSGSGKDSFKEIDECFTGMMAVGEVHEDVQLYSPKNCFFSHDMKQDTRFIHYADIDIENRTVGMVLDEGHHYTEQKDTRPSKFSLNDYVTTLCEAQNAVIVDNPKDADVRLTLDKQEGAICLIDKNYFMDEKLVSLDKMRKMNSPDKTNKPEQKRSRFAPKSADREFRF